MENRDLALEYSLSEEEPLTLPHFDDEATVQSARPVIPLHEVESASRSTQKMMLVASLCLAALVGAVAASLVSSNRTQGVEGSATATIPESAEEDPIDFITPLGEAGGATADPTETIATDIEVSRADRTDDGLEVQTPIAVSHPRPTKNARVPRPVEKVLSNPKAEPQDLEANERQDRREERREARRLRPERRAGDGLMRIREIFEGSPRP